MKITAFIFIMLSLSAFVGWVFWKQELQYALPTPVPKHFVDVQTGDTVNLKKYLKISSHPVLLHFFNPDCSCSRFNMQEFESLAHRYKDSVRFFVVLQSDDEEAIGQFNRKYELDLPVILDKDGSISDECGIFATPQAVLLDRNSVVYFKGNYNTARFCTRNETKFVALALHNLIENKPLPLFVRYAMTETYGCSLPSDEVKTQHKNLFSLFKN